MVTGLSGNEMKIVEEVLKRVCESREIAHAEVLQATESGLVLAAPSFCRGATEQAYREESKGFTFPLQVGIPGRVWMRRKPEWHQDVFSLPAHKFLRREVAIAAGFKGCVAVPFQHDVAGSDGPPTILVLIFYSPNQLAKEEVDSLIQDLNAATRELKARGITPALRRRASVDEQVQMLQLGSPNNGPMSPPLAPIIQPLPPAALSLKEEDGESEMGLDGVERVLRRVCEECDMAYAETLRPNARGMVLSTARYCRGATENKFYLESRAFTFPLQVGIPGRVWHRRAMEWHADVSALPAFKFLRRQAAIIAGLKGCIAVPFQIEDAIFVSTFYSPEVLDSEDVEKTLRCLGRILAEENGTEVDGGGRGSDWEGDVEGEADGVGPLVHEGLGMLSEESGEAGEFGEEGGLLRSVTLSSTLSAPTDTCSSPDATMHGEEYAVPGEEAARAEWAEGPAARNEIREEDVSIECMLGSGSSGHVYRALFGSRVVAAKFLRAEHTNEARELRGFYREAAILSSIKHPNVVGVVGVCMRRRPPMLLYELCDCTLDQYVEAKQAAKRWKFSVRKVKGWAVGLAAALECLQSHGLVHRDVKPSNLLLSKNKEVLKLADLGLCEGEEPQYVRRLVLQHFGQSAAAVEGEEAMGAAEIVGTLRYMPPEVWSGSRVCSHAGDVYSMGLVLWYMCSGAPPFEAASQQELAQGFVHRTQRREDLAALPSAPIAQVIERCWNEDPNERPTAGEVSALLSEVKVPRMVWPSAGRFHLKRLKNLAKPLFSPR